MNDLKAAQREYDRIIARYGPGTRDRAYFPSQELNVWMSENVVPAIEAIWSRYRFRREATWLVRAFKTPLSQESQLLNEMASALQESAGEILALNKRPRGKVSTPVAMQVHENDDLVPALQTIERIRKRRADQLLNLEDYFGARADAAVEIDAGYVQRGEFTC